MDDLLFLHFIALIGTFAGTGGLVWSVVRLTGHPDDVIEDDHLRVIERVVDHEVPAFRGRWIG